MITILACPQGTYDRVADTWFLYAALRILIVLLVSAKRLDVVRTLGLFALYEAVYLFLWRFFVWFSHPAVSSGGVTAVFMILLLILSLGVPAVFLLRKASRIKYFRGNCTSELTLKRSLLIIPFSFLLAILQGV